MAEVWYRYDGHRYAASLDEFDRPMGNGGCAITLREVSVLRHTAKGVWLQDYSRERFVLTQARKRWACPTKAEAAESYRQRKMRQARILSSQLRDVQQFINLIDKEN